MKIKIAVAQYDCPDSVSESIAKLNDIARSATRGNAQLLVAPETATGSLLKIKDKVPNVLPDLIKIATENKIYLATSIYIREKEKYFNQGYIISRDGQVVLKYKKIYLAPPEFQVDQISPGSSLHTNQTDIGRLGMIICKDGFNKYSHFLYDKLNKAKTDIVCIPTWSLDTWNINVQEYIKSLYTYGAFISRSFVLMSGNINKSTLSFGRSLVISPVNGVIWEGSKDREELKITDIDLDEVVKAREFDAKWQPPKRII